jgi:hypothetical protein
VRASNLRRESRDEGEDVMENKIMKREEENEKLMMKCT